MEHVAAAVAGEMQPSAPFLPRGAPEYDKRLAELDAKLPPAPRANVQDFVNHIDYAVKLIGIDHVGISSDFDGGGGIDGWNSAAEAFNVTLELVSARLHGRTDRKAVERQPASSLGPSRKGSPKEITPFT